jgi:uncharacterized membrane protein YsdA (DUF1294 family)
MIYLPIFAFILVYAAASFVYQLPLLVAGAYLIISLTCFVAYAIDKSAARNGGWRTPERSLLLLGLACGWPGGLLAQQWLRHKTVKQPFRSMFWASVAVNVAGFLWLAQRALAG